MTKSFHLGDAMVNPLKLTKEDFRPWWVADALAHINRYCGQGLFKLSVAQHSVVLSNIVPEKLALAALTHDVPEIFTGDVHGLLLSKLAPKLEAYQSDILRNLAPLLGIPYADYLAITPWDKRIVYDERKALFPNCSNEIPDQVCLGAQIVPLTTDEARNAWIARFSECAAIQQRQAPNGVGADVA